LSRKKKPSMMSRVCGMIVALIIIIVAVWIGLNAQQEGFVLVMYFALGIAALAFLLCIGVAMGKVTPRTYMGPLNILYIIFEPISLVYFMIVISLGLYSP